MHNIEIKPWGFQLTFGDVIDLQEIQQWFAQSKQVLKNAKPRFGVFVDMRALKPLSAEAQLVMQEGQKLYKVSGMVRSVVILASKIVTLQFQRIAKETGIYEWERYIDASTVRNWESQGVAWVRDGIDPDIEVA